MITPNILSIFGAFTAAGIWYDSARLAKSAATDLMGRNDARLAARRCGYKMKTDVHPSDITEDARLAATVSQR